MCLVQAMKENHVFIFYHGYIYGIKNFILMNRRLYSPKFYYYEYKFNRKYWVDKDPKEQTIERKIYIIGRFHKKKKWIKNRIKRLNYHIKSFDIGRSPEQCSYSNDVLYYDKSIDENKKSLICLLVKMKIDDIEEIGEENIVVKRFKIVTNKKEYANVMNIIKDYYSG